MQPWPRSIGLEMWNVMMNDERKKRKKCDEKCQVVLGIDVMWYEMVPLILNPRDSNKVVANAQGAIKYCITMV